MRFVQADGGRKSAGYKGRTGDCVTRAIAIATGKPYQEVYDALTAGIKAQRGSKGKGRTARTGVPKPVYRRYMDALGYAWTPTMTIGSGCRVHLRDGELPLGRLVVVTSGHLVAVIDGVIFDTHDCSRGGTRCVYGYYTVPTG